MRLDVAARLFDVELGQRRVVGTGARDQHVVDRRRQLAEELREPLEVGGVEGRDARAELVAGALEALGIAGRRGSRRLPRRALAGRSRARCRRCRRSRRRSVRQAAVRAGWRGAGCDAHDSSVQRPRIAFASRNLPARRAGFHRWQSSLLFLSGSGLLRVPRLFHPWKRERSPAFHASRSPGCTQVPVGTDFARHRAQIVPKIDDRRTPPEPVAVIDAVDHEARLEHERVRDHRIVLGVGVLLDVEIFLNLSVRV